MRERLSSEAYVNGILAGDRIILSRAITVIESRLYEDRDLAHSILQSVLPHSGNALRVGITGVPGVGKSTLIEALGMHLTKLGNHVAVLTVDPTSSKTGGSILGDKTRMEELVRNPMAFIRPSATGLSLGGVARNTREAMILCEAAGYNVILVETVGVGQSEILVKGMTDFFLLLTLPGAGDELQGIKKGIMEMVDAIAVNKADVNNAQQIDAAISDYQNAMHLMPATSSGVPVKIMSCSALENSGIGEIWDVVTGFEAITRQSGYFAKNRELQQVNWMHEMIRQIIEDRFYQNSNVKSQLSDFEEVVKSGKMLPVKAAESLIDLWLKS
ncbi:methylmalonyl Co-A mutase-associated GTPase MeaB [Dyadobacter crusticola]|uniref:methylmalonyl Co-A mutase-associated GTPase MeaB n=1 Tax=Dyadobacter crusticola TaxID=292407 RepID=UPI0004E167CA|nr:methylmalonyl Co-A mutase-associated GTPase MeaB [Dyadobacter crusticola]